MRNPNNTAGSIHHKPRHIQIIPKKTSSKPSRTTSRNKILSTVLPAEMLILQHAAWDKTQEHHGPFPTHRKKARCVWQQKVKDYRLLLSIEFLHTLD